MTEELEKEIRAKGGRIFPMTPLVLYLTEPSEYNRRYIQRKKAPLNKAQAIGLVVHRILQVMGTKHMSFPDPNKLRNFVYGVYARELLTDRESQRTWEFLKKQNALEGVCNVLDKYFTGFSFKDVIATEVDFLLALDDRIFLKGRFDQIRMVGEDYCVIDFKFNTPLPERAPSLFVIMELLIQEIGFFRARGIKPIVILHDLSQSKRFVMDSGAIDQKRFLKMLVLASHGIRGKIFSFNQATLSGFTNPCLEAKLILEELKLSEKVRWIEKEIETENPLICGDHLREMSYDSSRGRWLCPECSY